MGAQTTGMNTNGRARMPNKKHVRIASREQLHSGRDGGSDLT